MRPVRQTTLVAADGVELAARHLDGVGGAVFVVVHGFNGNGLDGQVQVIVERLAAFGDVITVDLRGHGASSGQSTVGRLEILDVDAAIRWARDLGYAKVITVGFSLGAAVAIRQAGLASSPAQGSQADPIVSSPPDVVIAVSGPAFWYYRGTRVMRLVHWLIETQAGRRVLHAKGTRVAPEKWPDAGPVEPVAAAGMLAGTPLLVIHGTADRYFPLEHPQALHRAALEGGNADTELWVLDGIGHAEAAMESNTIDELARWGLARCAD
ncbi:MAG: alpha/beta fold hydrolase [Actinomycetota bacterium]|nr:alpha/beta fold hydrolase [Actinomycetota bacterium]